MCTGVNTRTEPAHSLCVACDTVVCVLTGASLAWLRLPTGRLLGMSCPLVPLTQQTQVASHFQDNLKPRARGDEVYIACEVVPLGTSSSSQTLSVQAVWLCLDPGSTARQEAWEQDNCVPFCKQTSKLTRERKLAFTVHFFLKEKKKKKERRTVMIHSTYRKE